LVITKKKHHSETETHIIRRIIFDIANYAFHNCRDCIPKLENIDLIFATIPGDYEILGIADNSLYKKLSENDRKRYKEQYLIPELIYEAPAGVQADDFLLTFSYTNNDYISSNDQFMDHEWPPRDWIISHRIPFMIIKKQLILRFPNGLTQIQIMEKKRTTLDVLSDIEKSDKNSDWDLY